VADPELAPETDLDQPSKPDPVKNLGRDQDLKSEARDLNSFG